MTEAQRRAYAKFAAEHIIQVSIKLNKNTDSDIIERLNQAMSTDEGKQGYIKRLIKQDIKEEKTMKKITFTADGTCNIMHDEDMILYAETTLPEDIIDEYGERTSPVSEDYGYMALKAAIIALAKDHGIDPDSLSFWYDGQEQHLSDDAHAECDVRADWRE